MLISEHRSEMDDAKNDNRRAFREALQNAETVYDDRVDKLKQIFKRQRVDPVKTEKDVLDSKILPLAAATPPVPGVVPQANFGIHQQAACVQMMQQRMRMRRLATPRP